MNHSKGIKNAIIIQQNEKRFHSDYNIISSCCSLKCCLNCISRLNEYKKCPKCNMEGFYYTFYLFEFKQTCYFLEYPNLENNVNIELSHNNNIDCLLMKKQIKTWNISDFTKGLSSYEGRPLYRNMEFKLICPDKDIIYCIKFFEYSNLSEKSFSRISCFKCWEDVLKQEMKFHLRTNCIINCVSCISCKQIFEKRNLNFHLNTSYESKLVCTLCKIKVCLNHECPLTYVDSIHPILNSIFIEYPLRNKFGKDFLDWSNQFYLIFSSSFPLEQIYILLQNSLKSLASIVFKHLFIEFLNIVEEILVLFREAKNYPELLILDKYEKKFKNMIQLSLSILVKKI